MGKPAYPILIAALAAIIAVPQLAAFAQGAGQHQHEQSPRKPPQRPQFSGAQPGPAHSLPQGSRHLNPPLGAAPSRQVARYAHRPLPSRDFGGHVYHGHVAWEHGRWRHEMHNGRYGWWWDVGGVWYFYPQPIVGPPSYVSDVEVLIPDPDSSLVEGDYPPPDETSYPLPPDENIYSPPPPDQETVGDAVGSGADISAEAEQRNGYYWWRDNCYYRYPSGAYAPVDPRYCY
jgi:hypothetical protein